MNYFRSEFRANFLPVRARSSIGGRCRASIDGSRRSRSFPRTNARFESRFVRAHAPRLVRTIIGNEARITELVRADRVVAGHRISALLPPPTRRCPAAAIGRRERHRRGGSALAHYLNLPARGTNNRVASPRTHTYTTAELTTPRLAARVLGHGRTRWRAPSRCTYTLDTVYLTATGS